MGVLYLCAMADAWLVMMFFGGDGSGVVVYQAGLRVQIRSSCRMVGYQGVVGVHRRGMCLCLSVCALGGR